MCDRHKRVISTAAAGATTRGGRTRGRDEWTSCRSAAASRTGAPGARCPSRSSPTGWASRRAGSTRSSAACAGSTSSPSSTRSPTSSRSTCSCCWARTRSAGPTASTASTRSRSRRSAPRWSATTRSARSSTPRPTPPPLAEMRKAVSHAWLTYQHAKYGVLARALPKLLRDAQAADTAYAGARRAAATPPTCSGRSTRSPRRRCASWASTSCPGWPPTGRSRCPSAPATSCSPASPPTGSATRCSRSAGPAPRSRSTSTSPTGWRPATATTRPPSGSRCTACCCSRARWRRPGSATARPCATCSPAPRRRRRRWAATRTTTGPASARPTCSCTGPPPRSSWARAGMAVDTHESIDAERLRGAAAGAPGAPLPRHRPRVRADRRRRARPARCCWRATGWPRRRSAAGRSPTRCSSDVLRRTRGAPPAPVAELAEHMGVGV